MNSQINLNAFIAEIDQLNEKFCQFDLNQIEDLIGKYKFGIPFCANEEVEKKLQILAGRIEEFSLHSKVAKRLSLEVNNLALTVFMPAEIREKIFLQFDPLDIVRFSSTCHFYRDFVQNSPKVLLRPLVYKIFIEALKNAQTVLNKTERDACLNKTLSAYAWFDPDGAMNYLPLMQKLEVDDHEIDTFLSTALRRVALVDPERALKEAERHIQDEFIKNLVVKEAISVIARTDVPRAFEIAELSQANEARLTNLACIANAIYKNDPEMAIKIFEEVIGMSANIPQTLHLILEEYIPKEANVLETISKIEVKYVREDICAQIIVEIGKKSLLEALKALELIQDENKKIQTLIKLAKITIEIDPEQGKTLLQDALKKTEGMQEGRCKYRFLIDIAQHLAIVDLEQALQIWDKIDDPWFKDECLIGVSVKVALVDPKRALGLYEQIENKTIRGDPVLKAVIKAYLSKDLSWAILLINKVTSTNTKDILYIAVAISRAQVDLDLAMEALRLISCDKLNVAGQIQVALKIVHEQPKKAEMLILEALAFTNKITYDDHALKTECQIQMLAELISFFRK
jgi:hypothetical protein